MHEAPSEFLSELELSCLSGSIGCSIAAVEIKGCCINEPGAKTFVVERFLLELVGKGAMEFSSLDYSPMQTCVDSRIRVEISPSIVESRPEDVEASEDLHRLLISENLFSIEQIDIWEWISNWSGPAYRTKRDSAGELVEIRDTIAGDRILSLISQDKRQLNISSDAPDEISIWMGEIENRNNYYRIRKSLR